MAKQPLFKYYEFDCPEGEKPIYLVRIEEDPISIHRFLSCSIIKDHVKVEGDTYHLGGITFDKYDEVIYDNGMDREQPIYVFNTLKQAISYLKRSVKYHKKSAEDTIKAADEVLAGLEKING